MLRLSELSGFLVGGIVREKIVLKNIGEKSRQKTATENPFPTKLWGGVICGVVGCVDGIYKSYKEAFNTPTYAYHTLLGLS